ncbi:acyltransferase family protein [uncultured Microbacterium sp.]|uniref:Putative acyltransferase n=1 Tax=uncultured Microbacterium sp. TaxID=191216 RepID=A0A1Y5P540_9MICO|nr:acyltransferase family protein [uncultured Microbacterium sp.]SBS71211.1 putative acyltransferase [uncultured Microbacterium sp.]
MTTARNRLGWVDAGRGLAIALVVFFHTAQWLREAGLEVTGWVLVNETIATLRLPVFFLLAGLFAQKWMTAPWRSLWGVKLSLFAWVYLLWSVIATFTFMLGLNLQGAKGNYLAQLAQIPFLPFAPRFELWFIWALAFFFVIARLLFALPVSVQLAGTAVLSFVSLSWSAEWFPEANTGWAGLAKYFFFFLVGLHLRSTILRASERLPAVVLTAGFVLWLAMAVLGTAFGWGRTVPGYYFATSVVGLIAGLGVAKVISHWRGLRRLGAQTLPVYVTHTSIILLIGWLLALLPNDLLAGSSWGWLLVPTVAATAIAASLTIAHAVADRGALRYLYVAPAWFSGSPARVP